jgi:hypothetical protein
MSGDPSHEDRIRLLERKMAAFEDFFRDLAKQAPPSPAQPAERGSEQSASGDWVTVTVPGLGSFPMKPGEDPQAAAEEWRRIAQQAPPDAGLAVTAGAA